MTFSCYNKTNVIQLDDKNGEIIYATKAKIHKKRNGIGCT